MKDPTLVVQDTIIEMLRAAVDIGDIIHDRVKKGTATPYISIGPAQSNQQDADCFDGFEVFQQLDVWSEQPGYSECKELSEKVRAALHKKEFSIGVNTFEIEHQFTNYFRDPDGLTSHGVLSFRVLMDFYQGD